MSNSRREGERELYDEINRLIDIPDVMRILDSSDFFKDQYLKQTFKTTNRFQIDKIHSIYAVPLKKSLENRLIKEGKNSIMFSSFEENHMETELQLSNFVEQEKPKLKYFTMGSQQNPDQFEGWSPEKMYNWWLKLRTSGIPLLKWKILDAVFFLFINQISCICNSYIKYGIKNNSKNKKVFKEELELLKEYFRLLDEFYKSGGEYGKLLETHLTFCFWFQFRIRYDDKFKVYVDIKNENDSIFKLFNKKNKNKINYTWLSEKNSHIIAEIDKLREIAKIFLILFTSYYQNASKFISLYSIPVITAIGVPHKSHNANLYSPVYQIWHDVFNHHEMLLKYLISLYNQKNPDDINIFRKKMMFLQLLSNKKDSDAQLLFWYIIHESEFNIEKFVINKLIPKQEIKKIKSNILSKYTANVNKKLQYLKMNDENIYKFFDIEILLEQLKLMKIFLIELTLEENKKALPKIIHSIDVLIETCEETIEIVKNQRNKNYNNYMIQRQSNLSQDANFTYTSG